MNQSLSVVGANGSSTKIGSGGVVVSSVPSVIEGSLTLSPGGPSVKLIRFVWMFFSISWLLTVRGCEWYWGSVPGCRGEVMFVFSLLSARKREASGSKCTPTSWGPSSSGGTISSLECAGVLRAVAYERGPLGRFVGRQLSPSSVWPGWRKEMNRPPYSRTTRGSGWNSFDLATVIFLLPVLTWPPRKDCITGAIASILLPPCASMTWTMDASFASMGMLPTMMCILEDANSTKSTWQWCCGKSSPMDSSLSNSGSLSRVISIDRPCLLVNQPRGDWYPAASNARLTSSSVNWVWGGGGDRIVPGLSRMFEAVCHRGVDVWCRRTGHN